MKCSLFGTLYSSPLNIPVSFNCLDKQSGKTSSHLFFFSFCFSKSSTHLLMHPLEWCLIKPRGILLTLTCFWNCFLVPYHPNYFNLHIVSFSVYNFHIGLYLWCVYWKPTYHLNGLLIFIVPFHMYKACLSLKEKSQIAGQMQTLSTFHIFNKMLIA